MSLLRRTCSLLAATAFLAACDDDPTGPEATLALTVTPTELTIEQGTIASANITAVREGTTEPIVLSVSGPGAAVFATIMNIAHDEDETTASLRVTVGGAATPGTYTYVVKASNDDADDVTQQVVVTVQAPGGGGGEQ